MQNVSAFLSELVTAEAEKCRLASESLSNLGMLANKYSLLISE